MSLQTKPLLKMTVLWGLLVLSMAAFAKDSIYQKSGLAIKGYDPVAYFTEKSPVKGKAEHAFVYMEAKWLFASAENLAAFKANPAKYAPQYGGYCAYAVAKGSTAKIDPEAWKIVDGKLYLNYSKSIQKKWEKDISGYIQAADANWPNVLK